MNEPYLATLLPLSDSMKCIRTNNISFPTSTHFNMPSANTPFLLQFYSFLIVLTNFTILFEKRLIFIGSIFYMKKKRACICDNVLLALLIAIVGGTLSWVAVTLQFL